MCFRNQDWTIHLLYEQSHNYCYFDQRFFYSRANIGIRGAGSSKYVLCSSLSRTYKVSTMLLLIEPIIKISHKIWRVVLSLTTKRFIDFGRLEIPQEIINSSFGWKSLFTIKPMIDNLSCKVKFM